MLRRLLSSQPDPLDEAVVAKVATRPYTDRELVAELVAEGRDLGSAPELALDRLLEDHPRVRRLGDGRLIDAVALVRGAVATTVVTDEAVSWKRLLDTNLIDLSVVRITERALPVVTVSGEEIRRPRTVSSSLHAKRWMFATETGMPTRVRVGDGTLHFEPVAAPAPNPAADDPLVTAIGRLAVTISEERVPASVSDFVLEVAIEHPGVLTTERPPLSALFSDAGLDVRGDHLVVPGLDWDEWLAEEADAWVDPLEEE